MKVRTVAVTVDVQAEAGVPFAHEATEIPLSSALVDDLEDGDLADWLEELPFAGVILADDQHYLLKHGIYL